MRPLDDPRASSFMMPATSLRVARRAGMMPAMSVDRHARAATKPITTGSRVATSQSGVSCVASPALKKSMPTLATTRPTAAPASASTSVSASSCMTVRRRLAPSAVRIAISLPRATVRASSRLATFAHAMRSTPNTAPSIV